MNIPLRLSHLPKKRTHVQAKDHRLRWVGGGRCSVSTEMILAFQNTHLDFSPPLRMLLNF